MNKGLFSIIFLMTVISTLSAEDWPRWFGPEINGISEEKGWFEKWGDKGPDIVWRRKVGLGYACVSIKDGKLYTMGTEGNNEIVYCMNPKTGEKIWKYPIRVDKSPSKGWPGARISPLIHDSKAYALTLDGQIVCLDADKGIPLWKCDTRRTLGARGGRHGFSCNPVIYGDKIFFELGTSRGNIVAFDKDNGKVVWQSGKSVCGHASPAIYKGSLLFTQAVMFRRMTRKVENNCGDFHVEINTVAISQLPW
jgi:outer membrane protein assembly factor BamB